jgi:hypothetical protein
MRIRLRLGRRRRSRLDGLVFFCLRWNMRVDM